MDKNGKNGALIFTLVLIIVMLGFISYKFYFPTGATIKNIIEPKLSVSGVSLDTNFGISKGCSTIVNGYISNVGNANADGVFVECRLIGSGGGSTKGTRSIGSISNGGNSYFTININNDCPRPDSVECSASCQNCR